MAAANQGAKGSTIADDGLRASPAPRHSSSSTAHAATRETSLREVAGGTAVEQARRNPGRQSPRGFQWVTVLLVDALPPVPSPVRGALALSVLTALVWVTGLLRRLALERTGTGGLWVKWFMPMACLGWPRMGRSPVMPPPLTAPVSGKGVVMPGVVPGLLDAVLPGMSTALPLGIACWASTGPAAMESNATHVIRTLRTRKSPVMAVASAHAAPFPTSERVTPVLVPA